jgi:hypothetical protein
MHDLVSAAAQGPVMKAALGCLGQVTAAADAAEWPAAVRPFGLLLRHSLDERPKVRRRAQEAAAQVLAAARGGAVAAAASDAVLRGVQSNASLGMVVCFSYSRAAACATFLCRPGSISPTPMQGKAVCWIHRLHRPFHSHESCALQGSTWQHALSQYLGAHAVAQHVLPGPEAAARAAAAAPAKKRAAAEAAITKAVADALHLLGLLRTALPLMTGLSPH